MDAGRLPGDDVRHQSDDAPLPGMPAQNVIQVQMPDTKPALFHEVALAQGAADRRRTAPHLHRDALVVVVRLPVGLGFRREQPFGDLPTNAKRQSGCPHVRDTPQSHRQHASRRRNP